MRRHYPIHIIRTAKLQHEEVYWKAKNVLVYLPDVRRQKSASDHSSSELGSRSFTDL